MFDRAWISGRIVGGTAVLLFASIAIARTPPKPAPPKPADNSYCFACHAAFKHEKLAEKHRHAGVGCETCHGRSEKHSADEDNITPPDAMYAKAAIAPACRKCHPATSLQRDAAHKLMLAGKAAAPYESCTDCHGMHRMAHRTRRWDKVTRRLIKDDGVRMMGPGK